MTDAELTRYHRRFRWKDRTFTAWVKAHSVAEAQVYMQGLEDGFRQAAYLHTAHGSPTKSGNAFHAPLEIVT